MTRPLASVLIVLCGLAAVGMAISTRATSASTPPAEQAKAPTPSKPMKIRLIVDGTAVPATLDASPSGRDFATLLPLTLTLTDYGDVEKISDLPRALSKEGAPAGMDPEVGDITYYAPWGNLAIFVKDFSPSRGLIRLGRLDGDISPLKRKGALSVRIERVDP
jgi:hypothetical protein